MTVPVSRSVGYCLNAQCVDYAKGALRIGSTGVFYCSRCKQVGRAVAEQGRITVEGDVVREVRVEYAYCPATGVYREIAVLRDEALRKGATYTLQSPLIQTETRAFKVAEHLLVSLSDEYGVGDSMYREHLLSFDDSREAFSAKLHGLMERFGNNRFFKEETS